MGDGTHVIVNTRSGVPHTAYKKTSIMRNWCTMRTMTKMRAIKKTTPKLQEWRMTEKAQECDTMKKSQEWIAITRSRR